MFRAGLRGREHRICGDVRNPETRAEPRELVVRIELNEQEDLLVAAPVAVDQRIRRMRAAAAIRKRGVADLRLQITRMRPDAARQERGADLRPAAGPLASVECEHDRPEHRHRGRMVPDRRTRHRGRSVSARHARHQAGARPVGERVERRRVRVFARVAVTGDVRVDESRILGGKRFVVDTELGDERRLVVRDEDVRGLHQPQQHVAPFRPRQIQRHASLVPRGEQPRVVDVTLRGARRDPPEPPEIPALRSLDLDDVRTEVRHHGRRGRARDVRPAIDHAEAREDAPLLAHETRRSSARRSASTGRFVATPKDRLKYLESPINFEPTR